MPYVDDVETALLKNIALNVVDSAVYTGLTIVDAEVMDVFTLLPRTSRYAVVTKAPPESIKSYTGSIAYWLPVTVYIVDSTFRDIQRKRNFIGDGTTPGLLTEADVVRKALVRPSPYDMQIPSVSYTTQADVKAVRYDGTEEMGDEDRMSYLGPSGDPDDALGTQVQIVRFLYFIVDALN